MRGYLFKFSLPELKGVVGTYVHTLPVNKEVLERELTEKLQGRIVAFRGSGTKVGIIHRVFFKHQILSSRFSGMSQTNYWHLTAKVAWIKGPESGNVDDVPISTLCSIPDYLNTLETETQRIKNLIKEVREM